jgi:hypothetical protein
MDSFGKTLVLGIFAYERPSGATGRTTVPGLAQPTTSTSLPDEVRFSIARSASEGVDPGVRDRLLGVVEGRCTTGTNGASWQVAPVRELEGQGGLDRIPAPHRMLRRYVENMHSNEPVHTWEQ